MHFPSSEIEPTLVNSSTCRLPAVAISDRHCCIVGVTEEQFSPLAKRGLKIKVTHE